MTHQVARTLAPAKVNLALYVGARREDGFHELVTVFQAISLADEVEVRLGPASGDATTRLVVTGPDLGPEHDNLAWRAADALRRVAHVAGSIEIRLTKHIPAGAGLGGGSSDAAAVLRCLAVLVGHDDPGALNAVAAALGSDVPFFLGASPTAAGRGRGERIDRLPPLPERALVVAMPSVHVSTPGAYAALASQREGRPAPRLPEVPTPLSWDAVLGGFGHNDFEDVVAPRHPEIAASLSGLRDAGAEMAMLSGSGAASFGLMPNGRDGRAVAERLSDHHDWPFLPHRTLSSLPPVERVRDRATGGP